MTVYLSNLWARETKQTTAGFTISKHEFLAVQAIDRLFADAPLRLPEMVRGLIDGLWIHRVPKPESEISPPDLARVVVMNNAFVVGAATRNSVRAAYLDAGLPFFRFDFEDHSVRSFDRHTSARGEVVVTRGARVGEVIGSSLQLAIVEKLKDPETGAAIFFCLGVRGDTSWAATEYLVRNWTELQREFADESFALCIGFAAGDAYLDRYVEPRRMTPTAKPD